MKKVFSILTVSMLAMLLFAGIASAHVVVYPNEAIQGSYEKFTVRVPNEKEVPTTKVEVLIPAEVTISRFEPMAGWKYDLTKDATEKITSVIWTATGEGLSSTEFGEFNMQGKVGDTATSLTWKAHQTYKDGTVVDWVGAAGSEKPASVTAIKAKITEAKDTNTSLYLSIAALVLAVLAIIIAARKK
ncbi:MAG: YcnI family protein [Paenibacillaceae bacterium]